MTRSLTSLQNPIVKHLVRLRKESSYREEHETLVMEGLKPIQEVSSHIINLFYTDAYASLVKDLQGEHWEVTDPILQKISGMTQPEGVVAEVKRPPFLPLNNEHYVLALDGINDPGNLGTLLRTALALGWEAAFFLPGCCDPFNEKALRAARGAQFKLKMSEGTVEELSQWTKEHQVDALAADISGKPFDNIPNQPKRLLILGNEAHGIGTEVKKFSSPITIPMAGNMESLNVAIAGGILLYSLKPHGGNLL